jgi:DNA polymerase III gamma/tau subunit
MSLHTKYRPDTFDAVLGQETVIRSLKRVVKDGRAHAFIFTGPSGTGKTTLARILANEFAGNSRSMVNLDEIDGASKSGADDVRELVTRSLYRAIGGSPVKFIIIDEAHRLSAAAWTVFLKPVEEPPAHVYYAFCTTEVSKIPKAIITRCLRFDLKPVKEELILDLLVRVVDNEQFQIDDEIIEAIAENANGSPRQALVYLEECLACKSAAEARQLMRSAGQSKELIDLARWLVGGKGHSWAEAAKYVKALEGTDGESCRIVLTAYLSSVLMNTKNDKTASNLLRMMECFSKPYSQSDKLAPLMLSIGLAIGLDQ